MDETTVNETTGESRNTAIRPSVFSGPARKALHLPGWIAALVCALLIAQFFVLSLAAIRTKAPTYDENFHVLGAYSACWLHDYRIDPDNFTLWEYWAALPQGKDGVHIDQSSEGWNLLLTQNMQRRDEFAAWTLYHTPANDVDAIVGRSRTMMLILGVALAAIIGRWSFELGGSIAAIGATALFTFDPNFLGHAPLVKNDVTTALVIVLAAYATWRVGRRATVANLLGLALTCGALANVKASALVVVALLMFCLALRAVFLGEWQFLNRALRTRARRLLSVASVAIGCAAVTYAIIWTCYGFRFVGTPDPSSPISLRSYVDDDRLTRYMMTVGEIMPAQTSDHDWPAAPSSKLAMWIEQHRLLPQAWICGVVYAAAELRYRLMFLCNQISIFGWWHYFIYASAFKLPMATLTACALAVLFVVRGAARIFRRRETSTQWVWPFTCVVGVALTFFVLASASHIDLGVRHIFPVYALLYVALGWLCGIVWQSFGWTLRSISVMLIAVLMIESIGAFPNYIAYFNAASGGSRGGLNLLSDANLDWGQDLKLLADWTKRHSDQHIYLCYLGLADPSYYGINFTGVITDFRFHNNDRKYEGPGVLAIDAVALQGTFIGPALREQVARIRMRQPFEVLGGTIYLYHVQ